MVGAVRRLEASRPFGDATACQRVPVIFPRSNSPSMLVGHVFISETILSQSLFLRTTAVRSSQCSSPRRSPHFLLSSDIQILLSSTLLSFSHSQQSHHRHHSQIRTMNTSQEPSKDATILPTPAPAMSFPPYRNADPYAPTAVSWITRPVPAARRSCTSWFADTCAIPRRSLPTTAPAGARAPCLGNSSVLFQAALRCAELAVKTRASRYCLTPTSTCP